MNNKRIKYFYGIFAIMLLLLGALWDFPASARTLKYSDHEPLGGMRTRFLNDVLFPAIEKESNGRLKLEAHWGSELSTGYDALRLLGMGVAMDMAVVVPEYSADALPLHQIFKSFPVGPSGDKQLEFFRRVYAEIPAFSVELERNNAVGIFFATGFPVAFFSPSPLDTLSDIQGKWRSASFWHQSFLRNAGAEPVTMTWGDGVREALEKGTLKGLMVNIDSGDDIKAQKVAPNMLVSPDLWLGHVYILAMNSKTWNELAQEDKEAIRRAAAIAYGSLGSVMKGSLETMIGDLQKDGATIRILAPNELEQWQRTTRFQDIQATWIKEQEDKGIKDVGLVMEQVRAIMGDMMK